MKKELDYFERFAEMSDAGVRAAKLLVDLIADYRDVSAKADAIHAIEHEADELFHEMAVALNRAFITPIDREDILMVAEKIDSIIDGIEDVANLFDMLSVTEVRPEARSLAEVVLKCCERLHEQVQAFRGFKNAKTLNELGIEVNCLEEEGDRLHRGIIKDLYRSGEDVLLILKWRDIYDTMETVLDMCEDVADLMSGLAIKNG
ncbi:DUF47 domain-containing protein [Bacillota bacterium Meth-B3]